ncbi:MAG: AI-2E family transporter [Suilimivivens sp.]
MGKKYLTENQKKYVFLTMIIAGVYLFMRFLCPILSPFLLAFLFAGSLSRLTKKIPLKMKKSVLAGFILILGLTLFLLAIGLLFHLAVQKCGEMAGQLSFYEEELYKLLGSCCDFMESSFGIDGDVVEDYVLEQVNIFAENMEVKILPAVMNKSVSYVKNVTAAAGFLIVSVIAVFLILKDYDKILSYMKENEDFKEILEMIQKVVSYIKTYLKAQIVILIVIGTICALVLGFMGIEGGIVYGIITGFMDTLPFIGTGIMLIPLAILQLISKNYWQSAVIICLYAVCALTREFLEPRLIGSKVGIWPIGILFSVFAGIKLFGIVGIIKGPIGLVIICEACKYLFGKKESHVKENS